MNKATAYRAVRHCTVALCLDIQLEIGHPPD